MPVREFLQDQLLPLLLHDMAGKFDALIQTMYSFNEIFVECGIYGSPWASRKLQLRSLDLGLAGLESGRESIHIDIAICVLPFDT